MYLATAPKSIRSGPAYWAADDLRDRRYYYPLEHGYEATIAQRMEARADARAKGNRKATPPPGQGQWRPAGDIMGGREIARKKLAETEKKDAKA
jgi:hypothetical protein